MDNIFSILQSINNISSLKMWGCNHHLSSFETTEYGGFLSSMEELIIFDIDSLFWNFYRIINMWEGCFQNFQFGRWIDDLRWDLGQRPLKSRDKCFADFSGIPLLILDFLTSTFIICTTMCIPVGNMKNRSRNLDIFCPEFCHFLHT